MKKTPRPRLSTEAGFGLIEVLVMAVVIMIFAFAQFSMIAQQAPALLHASQKQEAARLQQMLLSQLGDPNTCKLNFAGQKFTSVKPPKVSPSSAKANGDRLYIGQGAAKSKIAQEGKALTSDHRSPFVDKIRISRLVEVAPSNFEGELVISFIHNEKITGQKTSIALRPFSIPITLVTSGPGASKTITDCVLGIPQATMDTCKIRTRYSTGDSMNTVCCNSNETIISWAAPLDPKSKAFEWQVANQTCGNIREIKGGNPVQLLCCK